MSAVVRAAGGVVVHGAGAHAAALWPVASLLAGRNVDLTAVDLPLYGRTLTTSRGTVTYEDWVDLLVELISAEDDGRPVILLGASIGGLLTVEAAARSRRVAAVVNAAHSTSGRYPNLGPEILLGAAALGGFVLAKIVGRIRG